jgi:hypothetical protein
MSGAFEAILGAFAAPLDAAGAVTEEDVAREIVGFLKAQWAYAGTLRPYFGYFPELKGVERPRLPSREWACTFGERERRIRGAEAVPRPGDEEFTICKLTSAGFGPPWYWDLLDELLKEEDGRAFVEAVPPAHPPAHMESAEARYFNLPDFGGELPDPTRPAGTPPAYESAG